VPKKGREKETRAKDQSLRANKQPRGGRPPGGKGTTKNRTLLPSSKGNMSIGG